MVRFKNRWILVEFIPCVSSPPGNISSTAAGLGASDVETNSKQIWSSLKQSIITHFGDTGWGAVGASLTGAFAEFVKYYSPRTNVCIIRVARDQHNIAWAGVTLLSSIEGRRYIPNVVHVSGTIKQAQIAAIRHNRTVVARYRALAKIPVGYQDSYEQFLEISAQEIEALQD
ncbi:uncharacterized protein FIBRA_00779 [Fibroporia radiculosa]|uniref:Ribonuclease P/MRP protein subunit POP5 n=1 Tax=Fibroporia radiculosa TaxID=599839 RepID=J4H0P5_9APHY|nr:uncharacterized protein FIBRA_00779 [Fibroporia radiculosa]CCL98774.1 predicted protein [Fibroporia radiculosa]